MFKYCHQLLCALPMPWGGGESKCYAGVQHARRERWIDLFEVRGWLLDVLRGVALCDSYCKQIWLSCGLIRKERTVISNLETSLKAKLDWAVIGGQPKGLSPEDLRFSFGPGGGGLSGLKTARSSNQFENISGGSNGRSVVASPSSPQKSTSWLLNSRWQLIDFWFQQGKRLLW